MLSTGSNWTDERVETLKKLWGEGASCSEIASELKNGISRNAVIGKIHRMGLSGRVKAPVSATESQRRARVMTRAGWGQRRKADKKADAPADLNRLSKFTGMVIRSAPPTPPAPPQPEAPVDVTPQPDDRNVSFMDLKRSMCRWPIGDPRDLETFRYCGADKGEASAYCAYHRQMAYQPREQRRAKAGRALEAA